MRANELKVGEEYHVSYHGVRCKMLTVGQGHGPVHTMQELDPVTGNAVPDKGPFKATSREILRTFKTLLVENPNYIDRVVEQRKREVEQQAEREQQEAFLSMLRGVVDETANLMMALGFEASVHEGARYKGEYPYYIRINNPTENQELLREMVAKKWGVSNDAE